jgi:hypothetical protein
MSKARVVAARSVDIGVTDLARALIFSTPIAPGRLRIGNGRRAVWTSGVSFRGRVYA